MKRFGLMMWFLCGLVAAAGGAERYPVVGTVRAVLSPTEVVVAHEEIPNFMAAMTMAFTLEQPLEADALSSGDRITGTLVPANGGYLLVDLRKDGGKSTVPEAVAVRGGARRLSEGDVVPDITLENQKREPDTLAVPDAYTVATFIFTRCPIPDFCPLMSQRFAEIQTALKNGAVTAPVRLLSLTLDPEFDTPELLREYGRAHGADAALWTLARATPDATAELVRAFRVFREKNGVVLDHTLATALIRPNGEVVHIWRGNGWTSEEVRRAIDADAALNRAHHAQQLELSKE